MKKIVITVVALLFAIPAFCALNPYLSIKGGYEYSYQKNKLHGDIDESIAEVYDKFYEADEAVFGLAAGHWFTDKFRAEIAYNYKFDNTLRTESSFRDEEGLPIPAPRESLKQHTVLINAYYHPFSDWIVSPYVGAGAGWGWSKYEMPAYDVKLNQNNFAYAFYLGADYKLTRRLTLDFSFTYNSILSDHSSLKDMHNYGGALALRYKI